MHSVDFRESWPHDVFDRDLPAILEIDSGETVLFRTIDAGWGRNAREQNVDLPTIELGDFEPQGHALCGPVLVRGARAGSALAVHIAEVRPERWGWTWSGPRPWNPTFEMGVTREANIGWDIDVEAGTAQTSGPPAFRVPLRPFMGVMGNAPAEPGKHRTQPPRRVGGNIDCRELVVGSTLYLPVEVDGALFSVGDGHATQGDGEVGQTAIECSMERVRLTFRVLEDRELAFPEADTPAGYVTMGFGVSLDEAAQLALESMLRHMERSYAIERPEAMALASLAVDLRVTQVVNGSLGVHALLPPYALTRL